MPSIDPALYGREQPQQFVEPPVQQVKTTELAQPVEAVPAAAAFAVSDFGAAARTEAAKPEPTIWESTKAAVKSWDSTSILQATSKTKFAVQDGFNSAEYLSQADIAFPLSEEERKFILRTESPEEFNANLKRVKEVQELQKTASAHPVIGGIVSMFDPLYIGADVLSGGIAAAAHTTRAARVVSATSAAVSAGTIGLMAAEEKPLSTNEIIAGVLLNGAAGSLFVGKTGTLTKKDPEFPDAALSSEAVLISKGKNVPVEQAIKEVDTSFAASTGRYLEWNINKTFASFGEIGKKIGDLFTDNNSNLSMNSIESQKRAVRQSLSTHETVLQEQLLDVMAAQGAGIWHRIFTPGKAILKQNEIERELSLELYRREQLDRLGLQRDDSAVKPYIKQMADTHDLVTRQALKELQDAGVQGAEEIVARTGWATRKWNSSHIEDIQAKFRSAGMNEKQAHQETVKILAKSMKSANGWDDVMSYDIAAATINRSLRKGMFEDSPFNSRQSNDVLKQMRDIFKEAGITGPKLERYMSVLEGKQNEAGKASFLKHRVDIDYNTTHTLPNGEVVRVTDMLDTHLTTNLHTYLEGISANVAFARKGIMNQTDIIKLHDELVGSLKPQDRQKASELFDNVVSHLQGRPYGASSGEFTRLLGSYGRMIALANSGIWQFSEYATIFAKYGLLRSFRHFVTEMPLFNQVFSSVSKDSRTSSQLVDVLTRMSDNDLRLKPYLQKFEDNFSMPVADAVHLSAQQASQLIPMVNAMKYISAHQARMAANLITDRVVQAAKGTKGAREMLEKYGIPSQVMDRISKDVAAFGMDTSKWSDGTWQAVRPAFSKMMDEAVLHSRLGDMPAYAMFDPVGKFIFTYRSFVLAAHNKILSGTISRDGFAGMGLLLLYQYPLTMMAVQAQNTLAGKKELTEKELATKAVGQMGALGLGGELYNFLSGQKDQVGAPGLIPLDRGAKLLSNVGTGNFEKAGYDAMKLVPLLSLIHPIRSFENLNKD